ncbi:MAG: phospho-sugar mutase, partial [Streptococcaceae bacterium]|nr:phospho-sugar mutase [Streptococcaceae bacterium]
DGVEKIKTLMEKFRHKAPKTFAGLAVSVTEDFKMQTATTSKEEVTKIAMSPSNVLKYLLEDGSWFAVRPSGTEPKIKFYLANSANNEKEAQLRIDRLKKEIRDSSR